MSILPLPHPISPIEITDIKTRHTQVASWAPSRTGRQSDSHMQAVYLGRPRENQKKKKKEAWHLISFRWHVVCSTTQEIPKREYASRIKFSNVSIYTFILKLYCIVYILYSIVVYYTVYYTHTIKIHIHIYVYIYIYIHTYIHTYISI